MGRMTLNAAAYRLEPRAPTLDEFRHICAEVGWEPVINFDAAEDSLDNSIHCVVAILGTEAVGMGRVVGDGAIYFYIQDVAVVPGHQGRGLGERIMKELVDWLEANAPEQAFIGLFAAAGTEPFYRRFGFETHAGMTGMFQTTPVTR
jgi:GNAT superfamily N-acetyltransferase